MPRSFAEAADMAVDATALCFVTASIIPFIARIPGFSHRRCDPALTNIEGTGVRGRAADIGAECTEIRALEIGEVDDVRELVSAGGSDALSSCPIKFEDKLVGFNGC